LLILVAVGRIAWEAVFCLLHPAGVSASAVIAVAGAGVAANTTMALLFWSGE